jgi:hypothetical protein
MITATTIEEIEKKNSSASDTYFRNRKPDFLALPPF